MLYLVHKISPYVGLGWVRVQGLLRVDGVAMSDWTSAEDPSSGSTYYYNAVTGETRWDAPEGFEAAAPAAAEPAPAPATPAPLEVDTECDWTSAVDPSSGSTYYYNEVTGETSWDKPAELAAAEAAAAAASGGSGVGVAAGGASPASPKKQSAKDRLQRVCWRGQCLVWRCF